MYTDKDRDPKSRDRQISEASQGYRMKPFFKIMRKNSRDKFKVSHIWEDMSSVNTDVEEGVRF